MKSDEHSAEMAARALRRAERRARSEANGPTPHKGRAKRTTTDADRVKAAHDKRERRRMRRFKDSARTLGGKR